MISDIGEFVAILYPAAGECLAKLTGSFPNIEEVKAHTFILLKSIISALIYSTKKNTFIVKD